jgi:hypothetical protein
MNKKNITLTGIGLEIYYENLGDTNEWTFDEAIYQMKYLNGVGWRFPTPEEMVYINDLSDLGVVNLYYDSYWCWKGDRPPQYGYRLETIFYSIEEFGKNWTGITTPDDNTNKSVRPVRDIR